MKHCIRCLYPETKPNIWFNEVGLCSACIAFDARLNIDWGQREKQFFERFKDPRVGVACSGGKDSTYLIVKLKQLGFEPTAICAMTDDLSSIGRYNLDNIATLAPLIRVSPNEIQRAKMSRYALETVGDISWCEHVLIWSIPARITAGLGFKTVFYGECPQNEYGAGPAETQQLDQMEKGWEHEFGGMLGLRVADMREEFPDHDFFYYTPPETLPARVFFGYYFPWDGYNNFRIAAKYGFNTFHHHVETSYFNYENLDNHQTGIHDYLRYVKYGYTRTQDILSNHIRRRHIDRLEALKKLKEVDPYPRTYLDKQIEAVLARIDMKMPQFLDVVVKFTNRKLFYIDSTRLPVPQFKVS